MAISKASRWSLIVVAGLLVIIVSPTALFMASNAGAAVINLMLNRQPKSTELLGTYAYTAAWGNSSFDLERVS
jgi:hypothetical protein